jgi:hypothetical protein
VERKIKNTSALGEPPERTPREDRLKLGDFSACFLAKESGEEGWRVKGIFGGRRGVEDVRYDFLHERA